MSVAPATLVGRTLLVLVIGLILSHLIGLAIYAGDRRLALTNQSEREAAERIAAVVRTFEQAAPAARPELLRGIWAPGFFVSWSRQSAIGEGDGDWRARLLRGAIRSALGEAAPAEIRIHRRGLGAGDAPGLAGPPGEPWMSGMSHMRHMRDMGMPMGFAMEQMDQAWRNGQILEASLRLADGTWLNFAALTAPWEPFWWSRYFLSIVVMTALVIALSVWAVRRATKPLGAFALAADRLGSDVNAPPVSEEGPREVSQLARAFNGMQRRLRSFVQDRTEMLAAISHDLRTPITRLRLRADFVEDEEQRGKILADLEQMEAMIAATLSFAREDFAQEAQKPFDLAVLLQDLCDEAADSGHAAVYEGAASLAYRGRPVALKRVFTNLIDNAVNYGDAATVSLSVLAGQATVTVEDRGPGIPEDQQEKVFAPFYRLEGSRGRDTGGVGLGLASVRSIVRAHGGEVALSNRPEGGLKVTVTLPSV